MLQLAVFREEQERVRTGLKKRNWTDEAIDDTIKKILSIDENRRTAQALLDTTLSEINKASKVIGELMKSGKKNDAENAKQEVAAWKEKTKMLEETRKQAENELDNILLNLPNLPNERVPYGKTPDDNEIWQAWIQPLPELGADAQPHWEISNKYGIFDLELGVKITGAGFPVFRAKGAKLVRALIQFFFGRSSKSRI